MSSFTIVVDPIELGQFVERKSEMHRFWENLVPAENDRDFRDTTTRRNKRKKKKKKKGAIQSERP